MCQRQSEADEELPKGSLSAAMVVAQQAAVKMHDNARWVLPKKPHRGRGWLYHCRLCHCGNLSLSLAGEVSEVEIILQGKSPGGIAICLTVTSRERQRVGAEDSQDKDDPDSLLGKQESNLLGKQKSNLLGKH